MENNRPVIEVGRRLTKRERANLEEYKTRLWNEVMRLMEGYVSPARFDQDMTNVVRTLLAEEPIEKAYLVEMAAEFIKGRMRVVMALGNLTNDRRVESKVAAEIPFEFIEIEDAEADGGRMTLNWVNEPLSIHRVERGRMDGDLYKLDHVAFWHEGDEREFPTLEALFAANPLVRQLAELTYGKGARP